MFCKCAYIPSVVIFSATHWFLALRAVWRKAQTQEGRFSSALNADWTREQLFLKLSPPPLISFFKPKVFSLQTCCLICHQKWWKLHFFFWFIVSVKMLQKLSLNSSCFFSALLLSFVILLFSLRIFCGLDSRLTKIPVHWVDKGDYCKIRWFSTRFSSRSWCLQGNEKLTASSFCKKKAYLLSFYTFRAFFMKEA